MVVAAPLRNPWRAVQLTDLHLYANPQQTLLGLNTYQSFMTVLAQVQRDHWPVDILLATGDLAQDGSEGAYQLLRQALLPLDTPTYYIPGNHDHPQLMTAVLPGHKISTAKQILLPPWQILLLDSTLPHQVGGYLDQTQLDFLEKNLSYYPDYHALICLHHHPLSVDCGWMEEIGLENGNQFFEVLSSYPQVRGVLWGHIHQNFEQQKSGLMLMASPSTCIQFKPQTENFSLDDTLPGYRWLELYEDGTLKTGVCRVPLDPHQKVNLDSAGY